MKNETASYRNVAILRPGRFTDSAGRQVEFSGAQLARIAGNFDPRWQRAPLTLDHEDSGPASGTVSALRWDGSFLRADLEDVPPELALQIDSGSWPARSAEIYSDRGEGHSLRALSLLGARAPAVKGLPAMPPASPGKGAGPPPGLSVPQTLPASLAATSSRQPRDISISMSIKGRQDETE